MGAFEIYVFTGLRPLACSGRTRQGLGISLSTLREALIGLYGRDYAEVWRTHCSHWAQSGDVGVSAYVALLWDLAEPPHGQGRNRTPDVWWLRPAERLISFSRWLGGRLAADEGHVVGLTYEGVVSCPRFGEVGVDSVDAVVVEVLRRKSNMQEAWYFVLPPPRLVGHWVTGMGQMFWVPTTIISMVVSGVGGRT